MRNRIYFFLFTLILNQSILAQSNSRIENSNHTQLLKENKITIFKFGLGPSISLPTGQLTSWSNAGLGLELTAMTDISPNVQLFGQLGYQNFIGKNIESNYGYFNLIDFENIQDLFEYIQRLEDKYGGKSPSVSNFNLTLGARTKINNLILGAGLGYSSFFNELLLDANGFNFSPQIGYSIKKIDIIGHWTNSYTKTGIFGFVGVKSYYHF